MPYCPKCKYEYRPGIEKCPDCDVKLVDKLHEEPTPEPEYLDLVQVGSFMYAAEAHEARLHLEANGIKAAVAGDVMTSINPAYMIADGGAKLLVPRADADRARELLRGD